MNFRPAPEWVGARADRWRKIRISHEQFQTMPPAAHRLPMAELRTLAGAPPTALIRNPPSPRQRLASGALRLSIAPHQANRKETQYLRRAATQAIRRPVILRTILPTLRQTRQSRRLSLSSLSRNRIRLNLTYHRKHHRADPMVPNLCQQVPMQARLERAPLAANKLCPPLRHFRLHRPRPQPEPLWFRPLPPLTSIAVRQRVYVSKRGSCAT